MMGSEAATRRLRQAITDMLEARGITEHAGPPLGSFDMIREDGSVAHLAYRAIGSALQDGTYAGMAAAAVAELKSETYPNRPLLWRSLPECAEILGTWRVHLRLVQLPEGTKTLTIRWPL